MRADRPSLTAQAVAWARAVESSLPADVRLFSDPLARECLGPLLRAGVSIARLPLLRRLLFGLVELVVPGGRGDVLGRTS